MQLRNILLSAILLVTLATAANAQPSSQQIIYSSGPPIVCRSGRVYVDILTGIIYTYKTGVGCIAPAVVVGAGDITGPSLSVDNELAVFSSTTGKVLKRATGTGFLFATSGVATYYNYTGAGNVVLSNSPVLTSPTLGTPMSVNLINGTGLPIATGLSGVASGGIAFLTTPTSANLASLLTDETGTGSVLFGTRSGNTSIYPTVSGLVVTGECAQWDGSGNLVSFPCGGGGGGSGDVVGPAASVDSELVLFNNTTGKLLKRASGTGFVFSTSGVASYISTTGTGNVVLASSPTIASPTIASFINSAHNHTNATGGGQLSLAAFSSTTGSGAIVAANSPTLITPNIGVATGTSLALGGNAVPTAANDLSFFAPTTSAQLAGLISDNSGSGLVVFNTSPTLVTPNLGTPSALTLTNATGLPVAGITGLGSGIGTFLATPTSANLAAAITNETGSGSLVFATSPTLITPNIGAATGTSLALGGFNVPTSNNNLSFFSATSSAQLATLLSDEVGSGSALFGSRSGNTSTFATTTGTLTSGRCVEIDASGNFVQAAAACSSGGSGSPGGSTTQVQYNNAGAFAGDAGMTYDPATDTLTVGALITTGAGYSNYASQSDSTVEGDIWRNGNLFKFRGSASTFTFATLEAANTFTADVSVPDEAYDATSWNGSTEVPTKNAVRDKIESLGGGGGGITNKEEHIAVGGCASGGGAPTTINWWADATLPPARACIGNTGEIAALGFAESNVAFVPFTVPSDWTSGAVTFTMYGSSAAAEAMTWEISTKCVAHGESITTFGTFNTAQSGGFTSGASGITTKYQQTSLTMTGCAAEEILVVRVKRTDVADNNFNMWKASVKFVIP